MWIDEEVKELVKESVIFLRLEDELQGVRVDGVSSVINS